MSREGEESNAQQPDQAQQEPTPVFHQQQQQPAVLDYHTHRHSLLLHHHIHHHIGRLSRIHHFAIVEAEVVLENLVDRCRNLNLTRSGMAVVVVVAEEEARQFEGAFSI